jgi:Uri superfamily endonuclease
VLYVVSTVNNQWPPRLEKLKGKKGTYALLFRVNRPLRVQVGKLGQHLFAPGIWVYVGSAMGTGSTSLGHRLRRHFSQSKKKHWHIDYLLSGKAKPLGTMWAESEESFECGLASALRDSRVFDAGPSGFGSTDCRECCGTHLFRYVGRDGLNAVQVALRHRFRNRTCSQIPVNPQCFLKTVSR